MKENQLKDYNMEIKSNYFDITSIKRKIECVHREQSLI